MPARGGGGVSARAARYALPGGKRRGPIKTLVDGRIAEDQLLKDIRAAVKEINEWCGRVLILCYHTHRSDRSEAGFPDLVLVSDGLVMYRELKADGKDPEPDQVVWLDMLERAGQDVGVWRPEDVVTGRVTRELIRLVEAGQARRREVSGGWTRSWS